MFDIDGFIDSCIRAAGEGEPRVAVREVLARAVSNPREVAQVLTPERAEMVPFMCRTSSQSARWYGHPGCRSSS